MEKVATLVRQIMRSRRLEDRLEYSVDDLARMYALTETEAEDLYQRLRRIAGWT